MTQQELATAIGKDRTYVNKVERGVIGMPHLETRLLIDAALDKREAPPVEITSPEGEAIDPEEALFQVMYRVMELADSLRKQSPDESNDGSVRKAIRLMRTKSGSQQVRTFVPDDLKNEEIAAAVKEELVKLTPKEQSAVWNIVSALLSVEE